MKASFTVEWPDELGETWMTKFNLLLALTDYCKRTMKDGVKLGVSDGPPLEPKCKICKDTGIVVDITPHSLAAARCPNGCAGYCATLLKKELPKDEL